MNTTEPRVRDAVFKAYRGKCFYSGRLLDKDDFHIDHLVPRAEGGADDLDNYCLCDPEINVLKSNKLDTETIAPMQYIVKTVFSPRARRHMAMVSNPPPKKIIAKPTTPAKWEKSTAFFDGDKYLYIHLGNDRGVSYRNYIKVLHGSKLPNATINNSTYSDLCYAVFETVGDLKEFCEGIEDGEIIPCSAVRQRFAIA